MQYQVANAYQMQVAFQLDNSGDPSQQYVHNAMVSNLTSVHFQLAQQLGHLNACNVKIKSSHPSTLSNFVVVDLEAFYQDPSSAQVEQDAKYILGDLETEIYLKEFHNEKFNALLKSPAVSGESDEEMKQQEHDKRSVLKRVADYNSQELEQEIKTGEESPDRRMNPSQSPLPYPSHGSKTNGSSDKASNLTSPQTVDILQQTQDAQDNWNVATHHMSAFADSQQQTTSFQHGVNYGKQYDEDDTYEKGTGQEGLSQQNYYQEDDNETNQNQHQQQQRQ